MSVSRAALVAAFVFSAVLVVASPARSTPRTARQTIRKGGRTAMPSSEGHLTTAHGVRLYFQTLGSGPQTVVIPNGFHLLDDFKRLADGRTLIFYDLRNRGRSDEVTDASKLKRGIHNDVDDLEAVRRHFGIGKLDLIGHSYMGLMVALYAMKHPDQVHRVVQVGPMQPFQAKQYPAHLMGGDTTRQEVFARLAELQKERASDEPEERCRKFWSVLRLLYVTNPADADRIDWGRCHLPNERNFLKYWTGSILPSIQTLDLAPGEIAKVTAPVLTIHGTRDRSAPYGGGREWALLLPNARLVTVENAGHAPWVEAPESVFGAIEAFLDGGWPEAARKVGSVDPDAEH
jgi:pimeloyl-ACP methyl ester carboxylesterase